MTTPQTIFQQVDAICDRFFSLDTQIDLAEQEHIAAGVIVDLLRDELARAIEHQQETRRRVMELRSAAIAQEAN